jgi:hypothetical protein
VGDGRWAKLLDSGSQVSKHHNNQVQNNQLQDYLIIILLNSTKVWLIDNCYFKVCKKN